MSKILAIVGSRSFTDWPVFTYQIQLIEELHGPFKSIVTGDAKGADKMARRWAEENNKELIVHHADWRTHGNLAGPKRNQKIVNDCDKMIAFPSHQGKGTQISIVMALDTDKLLKIQWVD